MSGSLFDDAGMTRSLVMLGAALAICVAGCGGSSQSSSPSGALSGEARSAATGDIPDNQVFLTYRGGTGGFTIRYPEGWARAGSARHLTFQDKNNIVRVVIGSGAPPTPGSAARELARLRSTTPSLRISSPPRVVTIKGRQVIKAVYATTSRPNPVTGKRVTLVVDRYQLGNAGRVATLDLGTPRGVDNVDAYRMMIESFRWK
jgi:hypothetical protein